MLLLSSCTQHGSSAAAQTLPPPITLSGLPAPTAAEVATTTATTEAADHHRGAHDDRGADHRPKPRPPPRHRPRRRLPCPSNVEIAGAAEQPLEAVGGHSGEATAAIQARLLQLGFWNSGADGKYGFTTKQAVMAFQKYIGLPPDGLRRQDDRRLSDQLRREGSRRGRHRHAGRGRQGQAVAVHRASTARRSGRSTRRRAAASPTRRPTRTTRPRSRRATRSRPRACSTPPANVRRVGGRATSARSTGRSTSSVGRRPRHDQRAEPPGVTRLRSPQHGRRWTSSGIKTSCRCTSPCGCTARAVQPTSSRR